MIPYYILPLDESEGEEEKQNEKEGTKSPKKLYTSQINRRIPIAVKLEAVEHAKKTSNNKAALKFNVSEKSIRYWRKQENELRKQRHQVSKITLHKGKNKSFIYDEKTMWIFAETNRKLGNPLTTWSLISELLKREPSTQRMSKNSLLKWCSRFENKFYLAFKLSKSEGKLTLADALHQLKTFFEDIKQKRSTENIDTIVSLDETPLFFNAPKIRRILHRGNRDILLETQKQEEIEVSVILSVASDGSKLPPFVIFKRWGKKDIEAEKNLKELAIVKRGYIFLEFNDNAWSNNNIMELWFQKVYWPFLFKKSNTGRGLIILDLESSHFDKTFLELISSRNQVFSLIPAGLTRIIQPLDVKINVNFKKKLSEIYEKSCEGIKRNINMDNIKKEVILDWIVNCWYDDNIVKNKEIYDTFKYCGISNSLDGKENNLIRNFDQIAEGVVKPDYVNGNENKNEKDNNNSNNDGGSSIDGLDGINSSIHDTEESKSFMDFSIDYEDKKPVLYPGL